jgi:NAD(P)-dependent dehydrogenase (short-subunit alcohol dehydrogenase family)
MHNNPVALVTGANQGIGLQIAKDLVTHGFTVLVGSRNLERGEAAAQEVVPDARAIQLDVTGGAREPVRLALLGPDGPTGTFSNQDGPLPW